MNSSKKQLKNGNIYLVIALIVVAILFLSLIHILDGGIVPETAKICKDAGADVFVAGSYIYGAENPVGQIERLKEALN